MKWHLLLSIFFVSALVCSAHTLSAKPNFTPSLIAGEIKTKDKKGVNVRACPHIQCKIIGGLPDGGPFFFHDQIYNEEWIRFNDGYIHRPFVQIRQQDLSKEAVTVKPIALNSLKRTVEDAVSQIKTYDSEKQDISIKKIVYTDELGQSAQFEAIINKNMRFKGLLHAPQKVLKTQFLSMDDGANTHCYELVNKSYISINKKTGKVNNRTDKAFTQILDLRKFNPTPIGIRGFELCVGQVTLPSQSHARYHEKGTFYNISKNPLFFGDEIEHTVKLDGVFENVLEKDKEIIKPFIHPHLEGYTKIKDAPASLNSITAYRSEYIVYYESDGKTEIELPFSNYYTKNKFLAKGKSFSVHSYTKTGNGRFYDLLANTPMTVNGYKINKGERVTSRDLIALDHVAHRFPSYKYDQNFGFVRNIDTRSMGDETIYIRFLKGKNKIFTQNPYAKIYIPDNSGRMVFRTLNFKYEKDSEKYDKFGKFHGKYISPSINLTRGYYNDEKADWYCEDSHENFEYFEKALIERDLNFNDISFIKPGYYDYNYRVEIAKEKTFNGVKFPSGSYLYFFKPKCSKHLNLVKAVLNKDSNWKNMALNTADTLFFEADDVVQITRDSAIIFNKRKIDIKKSIEIAQGQKFALCFYSDSGENPLHITECSKTNSSSEVNRYEIKYQSENKIEVYKPANGYSVRNGKKVYETYVEEYAVSDLRTINTLIVDDKEYFLPGAVSSDDLKVPASEILRNDFLLKTTATDQPILPLYTNYCASSIHDKPVASVSFADLKGTNKLIKIYSRFDTEEDLCPGC